MSIRTDLLALAADVRRIPGDFDIRQWSVTVRTRVWSGEEIGQGVPTDTLTALTLDGATRPRVREVTSREVLASGGVYAEGDYKVGPFTPAFTGGGRTPEDLNPSPAGRAEVTYHLVGPGIDAWCSAVDTESVRNFSYFLVLRRINTQG